MYKYRINWFSLETRAHGQGQPVFRTEETARVTAERLNKEHPLLVHTVEKVWVRAPETQT